MLANVGGTHQRRRHYLFAGAADHPHGDLMARSTPLIDYPGGGTVVESSPA